MASRGAVIRGWFRDLGARFDERAAECDRDNETLADVFGVERAARLMEYQWRGVHAEWRRVLAAVCWAIGGVR